MRINTMKQLGVLMLALLILSGLHTQAQYATKKVRSKHQQYTDSLKNVEYNYVLPILGQGAYKRGFDIPYPMGVMLNGIWMDQGIDISNMKLGLLTDNKDIPLTDVDEFIGFGDNRNTTYGVNVRPDLWIFPFLNVYGLFGYGTSITEVNLVAPVELKSIVEQNVSTAGVGVMGAFGIGPVWLSVDANWTWNKPELLDDPVLVRVLGLRLGKTWTFKSRPDRNIAVWVGAMRLHMKSETVGAVTMKDALPSETWERLDEIVNNYDQWYDGLHDRVKERVDETALPDIVDSMRDADGSSTIRYGMDKQTVDKWNGVIGMQYQHNKHWMLRTEAGVIGDRKSFMLSLNYRFLGFKK